MRLHQPQGNNSGCLGTGKKTCMLIGAHVPTMSDYRKMAQYAFEVGCECVQIFSNSPRSYAVPPVNDKVLSQLSEARATDQAGGTPFPPILVHVGYLVNLASDDPEQRARSRDSLAGEIVRAHAIGAVALNTHTGSSKDLPREEVAARIADTVVAAREIAGACAHEVPIVFEDTAGAGTTYGTTMAELAAILHELDQRGVAADEVGICIDTCHAWAAGYDLSCHDGWSSMLDEIAQVCEGGLKRLRWIHANDAQFDCGSHKDRHAWIGKGAIGEAGFQDMVCRTELSHVNVVIEMPGDMPEKDSVNVGLLKTWRDRVRS